MRFCMCVCLFVCLTFGKFFKGLRGKGGGGEENMLGLSRVTNSAG